MIPSPYEELVEELTEKTRKRKLDWETGSKESEFLTTLVGKSIVLRKQSAPSEWGLSVTTGAQNEVPEWDSQIYFSLRDEEGDIIDSFTCNDQEVCWNAMNELYRLVKREVHKIDEIVEEIEDYLKDI